MTLDTGPVGFKVRTSSDTTEKQNKFATEIPIGRLAMMAIVGMIFQDGPTGSARGDWALHTGLPRCASESELDVQDSAGLGGPASLTADGGVGDFARKRLTDLMRGCVSVLGTTGYIAPELTGKLPGYLSPSAGLQFADVPNRLGAIPKAPAAGWAQILLYGAFCGLPQGQSPGTAVAAGDFGFNVRTSSDPAEKRKNLAADIANGRLAMTAIIGMLFQEGPTGSARGDWALYTGSLLRAFENELGAQGPVGFWDPASFTAQGVADNFARECLTELKRGRVSVMGATGYTAPELTGKLLGHLSPLAGLRFADAPDGLVAISKEPGAGWAETPAFGAFCELPQNQAPSTNAAAAVSGFKVRTSSDPAEKQKKLAAEIAIGRLAMMAILGTFSQEGPTGSPRGDWALYTGSLLPPVESELGVQEPVGVWDPAGFTAVGGVENFSRAHQTEIRHGRESMLATLGYIAPKLAGKQPGYLSRSAGLKFAAVPNGLDTIAKVLAAGWAQILAHVTFCDLPQDQSPGVAAAACSLGFKVWSPSGPAEKQKKPAAEIANGRLAMMAIIGVFSQGGLIGSARGDWALYTGSPLRVFEIVLGVQGPVGCSDPAGFTADASVVNLARRRLAELKYGLVSMPATTSYITPVITGKLPSYLSPFNVRTLSDLAEKQKKLAADIANGRLARMAIIGVFFQDGLISSAWGDWALYTGSPLRVFDNVSACRTSRAAGTSPA